MCSAVPPIFVIDEDDVIVYASTEVNLEPLDVKAGGLVAYDAEEAASIGNKSGGGDSIRCRGEANARC